MNSPTPPYHDAVRAALVDLVQADHPPRPHRRPRIIGFGLAAALVLGGTGTAFATGLLALPGAPENTPLGPRVTVTEQGTRTIDLGPRHEGSTGVQIDLRCLSAGSFSFADGAGGSCDEAAAGHSLTTYYLTLPADETTTTITADNDLRWTAVFQYTRQELTPFAVNDEGLTYGVIATDGRVPDLIAVETTDRQLGYVYAAQLDDAADADDGSAEQLVPVYESDGTTRIGEFQVGG